MIHTDTELRFVSPEMGFGVFATKLIPRGTLTWVRDDLDRGVAEANATVSGYLFASAKAGNVAAQIFWLKSRAHWREKTAPDDPVPGSDAEANSPVVLVLPDNSRDPELTQVLRDAQ